MEAINLELLKTHKVYNKRGPKGPWKVKGEIKEALLNEFKTNPHLSSSKIQQNIIMKMGEDISPSRIRDFRRDFEKKNPKSSR